MRALLPLIAALVAFPGAAHGQDESPQQERVTINLIVYGEDPCPEAQAEDEIVVCARRPESERYRVPPRFREESLPVEQAWGARVEAMEEAQRDTRPDSCSPVGSFGMTGCTQMMLRRWRAERRAMESRPW